MIKSLSSTSAQFLDAPRVGGSANGWFDGQGQLGTDKAHARLRQGHRAALASHGQARVAEHGQGHAKLARLAGGVLLICAGVVAAVLRGCRHVYGAVGGHVGHGI